jgi:hypothetical protein
MMTVALLETVVLNLLSGVELLQSRKWLHVEHSLTLCICELQTEQANSS